MSESAISAAVSEPTALLRLALVELRREQFESALEHFDAALAVDPNLADIYAYHSGAMLALGRPIEAQADIAKAIELDPHGFATNQKAGELSLRLGDLGSAAESFLAAVRAARPGSADEKAASTALAMTRVRQKTSISHHARLPGGSRLRGLLSVPSWLPGRVRKASPETVTG